MYDKLHFLFPLYGANTVLFGKRTLPLVHLMTKMSLLRYLRHFAFSHGDVSFT